MAEQFFIHCDCGRQVGVELFEAGTSKVCPACRAAIKVPGTTKLKELSGDKYPLLRPIEKLHQTLMTGEAPFDGLCHGCHSTAATHQCPVTFNAMKERTVKDGGEILPVGLSAVMLRTGAAEELWQSTTFPLLLCDACHAKFQGQHATAKAMKIFKNICMFGLLLAFFYFVYYFAELIAGFVGLISMIGAIAWTAQHRQARKVEPFIFDWLNQIRWVPEALAGEDEYSLTVGNSRPIVLRDGVHC